MKQARFQILAVLRSWLGKWSREPVSGDLDVPNSDTRSLIRLGVFMLVFGLGLGLFWAATAPLDEGVPVGGTLLVESRRKVISHLTGGIVSRILVVEAQMVVEGEPLILLDDTDAKAAFESAVQTFYSLKAAEARLLAEQRSASSVTFPVELTHMPRHPLASQHMETQQRLFASRRASLDSDKAVLSQAAESSRLAARSLEKQVVFLDQELAGTRDLAQEGYASRNQQLLLERQYTELTRNALQADRAVFDYKLRIAQREQEYQREVATDLALVQRDVANAAEKYRTLQEDLDRRTVRAPVSGSVNALAVNTVGGVIPPGAKIMEIVPSADRMVFEVRIPAHLVDQVHPGLAAHINLHNFPDAPQLVIEGRLVVISPDLHVDARADVPPYFVATVEVTGAGLHALGKHVLKPGMPADVVIRTGERTLLVYLLKPLVRRLNSALVEP